MRTVEINIPPATSLSKEAFLSNKARAYKARAKINLDLLITGRLDDGYHMLDSLVVFADYGDDISVTLSDKITLDIRGPFSHGLDDKSDNIILKAARLLQHDYGIDQGAEITLVKNLPISSGIGGGSADAAATIKALIALWNIPYDPVRVAIMALSLGADVPVCMASRTMQMSGIGEMLRPIVMPFALNLLLVNAGVSVSTAQIFQARSVGNAGYSEARILPETLSDLKQLCDILSRTGNDLAHPACVAEPEIEMTLSAIAHQKECLFHGMSGSGATCFGLFSTFKEAQIAATNIACIHPHWWVMPVQTVCER